MGMHHNQDIRWMGGVRKYMPITWITSLLGSLALIGTPLFAGLLLQGQHHRGGALQPPAGRRLCLLRGAGRCLRHRFLFLPHVFPGVPRQGALRPEPRCAPRRSPWPRPCTTHHEPHESPWVVTVPLVLLAIPSVVIGFMTIQPMLFGDFFKDAIFVNAAKHPAMAEAGRDVPRPGGRWRCTAFMHRAVLAGAGRCGLRRITCT